jgi:hypothetical protein
MALIRKVDCVRLYVPDIEAGLVLQTEEQRQEVDLLVDSADEAVQFIEQAGGKTIVPPFDIQIGRCVVLEDPWGNPLVLLDTSKGLLKTDDNGNVIGTLD